MLTDRQPVRFAPRKFLCRVASLRTLALLLLPLGTLTLGHCAEEEPHYLPPLPDMAMPPSNGLPCEVSKLFADRCLGCHGLQPINMPPLSLVTYANLTATSTVDPTKKVAERVLLRMQDPANPMPPGVMPTVPASELAPLQSWLAAGTPMTACTPAALALTHAAAR